MIKANPTSGETPTYTDGDVIEILRQLSRGRGRHAPLLEAYPPDDDWCIRRRRCKPVPVREAAVHHAHDGGLLKIKWPPKNPSIEPLLPARFLITEKGRAALAEWDSPPEI